MYEILYSSLDARHLFTAEIIKWLINLVHYLKYCESDLHNYKRTDQGTLELVKVINDQIYFISFYQHSQPTVSEIVSVIPYITSWLSELMNTSNSLKEHPW